MTAMRQRMAEMHEDYLARTLPGARRTRASGSQFNDQTDVRQDRRDRLMAFAFDAKATLNRSASVKLADWDKVVEQAHHEQPGLALRFYADESLTQVLADLVVIRAEDFAALLEYSEGCR